MKSKAFLAIACCCCFLLSGCSLLAIRNPQNNSFQEIEYEAPSKPPREEQEQSSLKPTESSTEASESSSEATESSSESSTESSLAPTESSSEATESTGSAESSGSSSESSESSTETSAPTLAVNPPVFAYWADDVLSNYSDYTEFTGDTFTESGRVLIGVMGAVKDFRILALSVDHISDNGDISYYYETLYIQDYMTPDCPIVVRMTFAGSFPNYGFAFTDANGDEYMYALYLSGMDGSVGIEPIK